MRKLILILSLVCTVILGCCVPVLAFQEGDVIEGVTVTAVTSRSEACSEYLVYDGTLYIFPSFSDCVWNGSTLEFPSEVKYSKRNWADFVADGSLNTGSMSNTTSSTVSSITDISLITCGSFDIYDTSGKQVFPSPPVSSPAPEVTAAIVPQTMTQVLMKMIPLGLVVLAILFVLPFLRRFLVSFLR